MRIAFLIGSLSGGGAERTVCNLANYFCRKKHKVTVFCVSEKREYVVDREITIRYLTSRRLHSLSKWSFVIRLISVLLFSKQDVYISMLPSLTIPLLKLKWLTHAKIVVSERNAPWKNDSKKIRNMTALAHKADGWVFQTEAVQQWYGQKTGKAPTIIIPNAVSPEVTKYRIQGNRRKVIIAAGRLCEQKNHALLINAFSDIADKYPAYCLEIYGDGPYRQKLLTQIDSLNLTRRVRLPGTTTELFERLSSSALFVLTSDWEGMPNILIEAMSLGCPCISTMSMGGGPEYLIENGHNGILVPINDRKALAKAMDRILSDSSLSSLLGTNALEIAERLHPERIYKQWLDFINHIVHL